MKTIYNTIILFCSAIVLLSCQKNEAIDNRLSAPNSLRVSASNVLTWSIVKNAVKYLPNINGEDYPAVTSNQLPLSDVVRGGNLIIKIKAIGDNSPWMDSDWSEELNYNMAVALDNPIPSASGKTVTWDAIDGASGYEYDINGSIVITNETSIDLSEYMPEKYTIKVRALPADKVNNSVSGWSEEIVVSIIDRLASPELIVQQPSLKNPYDAFVSWHSVEGASQYEVYIDEVKQECAETSLDFRGKEGTFNVKVIAINPGVYDQSEVAETTITINDYGNGTADDPYKIYTVQDWNDFTEIVNTDESKSGYIDKYLELKSDLDFNGNYVEPAGVSELMVFKGLLDGGDFTLSNAKIGDGTKSHQAFFYNLSGTVKNLKFDNITVLSSNPAADRDAETSAGVIVAGYNRSAFTLDNCHVSNSSVTSGKEGDSHGAFAGGLVGRSGNDEMIIRNCSVFNTNVSCLSASAGGIIGIFSEGTIENVLSSGNTISSLKYAGGIVGNAGQNAKVVNCVSEYNVCTVKSTAAGGVIGASAWSDESEGTHPQFINILSQGNSVKSTYLDNPNLFLGLIAGGNGNDHDNCLILKNCLVLSGQAQYDFSIDTHDDYKHAGCIGVMFGYGGLQTVDNCYFNTACRSQFDPYLYANTVRTDGLSGGWYRDAVGRKGNNIEKDRDAGRPMDGVTNYADELSNGTCLEALNDWVTNNAATYPTLKTWVADSENNNYPIIKILD